MVNTPGVVAGSSTAFLAVFGLLGSSKDAPLPQIPIQKINPDNSLLSKWISDDFADDEPLQDECIFYNNTVKLDASACTLFTISRTSVSVFQAATDRAVRCASKAQVHCVLSSEIGFSLPAAYISEQTAHAGMLSIIAPKITTMGEEVHVRVHVPPDSLFESTTTILNNSISVEYMNDNKEMKSGVFKGKDAFCIQLLRSAFEASCWERLDA